MQLHEATINWTIGAVDVPLRVAYYFDPGQMQRGPTYSCAGEPGEGPSVDILSGIVDIAKRPALSDRYLDALQRDDAFTARLIERAEHAAL